MYEGNWHKKLHINKIPLIYSILHREANFSGLDFYSTLPSRDESLNKLWVHLNPNDDLDIMLPSKSRSNSVRFHTLWDGQGLGMSRWRRMDSKFSWSSCVCTYIICGRGRRSYQRSPCRPLIGNNIHYLSNNKCLIPLNSWNSDWSALNSILQARKRKSLFLYCCEWRQNGR